MSEMTKHHYASTLTYTTWVRARKTFVNISFATNQQTHASESVDIVLEVKFDNIRLKWLPCELINSKFSIFLFIIVNELCHKQIFTSLE